MANYPDWVMKYKEKGTYINYTNGKYYLYAAHSERIPGTRKVKRICDGYLGRITESDGLIPAKDKVSGEVTVLEYGFSTLLLQVGGNIHSGFRRNFKQHADFIMAAAILLILYGRYDKDLFFQSALSVRYPLLDFEKKPTTKQNMAIERGILMLTDSLAKQFQEDHGQIAALCRQVYLVKINNNYYRSKEPDLLKSCLENHGFKWEEEPWRR